MSGLLEIGADFIERMADPRFGATVNEEYLLRFGQMLRSEGFDTQLDGEMRRLRDAETFSAHGWVWVFGRAKSRQLRLSESLLVELIWRWHSPFFLAEVIEVATAGSDDDETKISMESKRLGGRFLAQLVQDFPEHGAADNLVVALLQVGTPNTIRAASSILQRDWHGAVALRQFVRSLIESFDVDVSAEWFDRLNMGPGTDRS